MYMFKYIYINPTRVVEIPIDTSHVLNTHALLSALFRQKESCHPYWHIIYTYGYGSKRIMGMPIYTSHVLNTHALLSAGFRQKDSCHPYWRIKYVWFQPGLLNPHRYQSCTKYTYTVLRSFQAERVLPPVLAYYPYRCMVPKELQVEIPILCTREVINTHALLSALFRQKDSCNPYWHSIDLYIYGSKKIVKIPIDTSHVLNTHALLSALIRQKESCHPYWHIK